MEIARYTTESQNTRVIEGKLACVKKGIAFCKLQLVSAATSFKTALSGISFEESLDIQDGEKMMMMSRTMSILVQFLMTNV